MRKVELDHERKPALVCGLFGTVIASLMFGFSPNFWVAVLARFLWGFLNGNIGVSIGKKSFTDDKLIKNYNAIIETLEKEKSNNTVKGDLVKSAFITSTMGVSYKLKLGKSI